MAKKCVQQKPRRKCSTPGCGVTTSDWYPIGRHGGEVVCTECFELRLMRETRESVHDKPADVSFEDDGE